MDIQVLMFILGGGFAGTWGLCLFFMNSTQKSISELKLEVMSDIKEIRLEISELKNCIKDHHSRIRIVEHELEL